MHLKFGEGMPLSEEEARRVNRINLAERFGWTLDYIDTLSYADMADIRAVIGAHAKLSKKGD